MAFGRCFLRRHSIPISTGAASSRGGAYSQSVPVGTPSQMMSKAAFSNDIHGAGVASGLDPGVLTGPLNASGDRAAHLAARMGYLDFVRYVVMHMTTYENLLPLDGFGHTPLTYAAISGRKDIAALLLIHNHELLRTADGAGKFPIYLAAENGREDVAAFLVDSARTGDFGPRSLFDFLVLLIQADFYGAAICIITKFPSEAHALLKFVHDEYGTVLHVLARKATWSDSQYSELADKVWGIMVSFGEEEVSGLVCHPCSPPVIVAAAKVGNLGLISRLLEDFPSLLSSKDEHGHDIFHVAVMCRRVELFRFGKEFGSLASSIFSEPDCYGNNLLHHAAMCVDFPSTRHDGMYPLMQLKRDVDWFRAMYEVLPLSCRKAINNENLTPSQLFAKQHEPMLEVNRAWLRRAAKSCLMLAMMVMSLAHGLILNSIQSFDDEVFVNSKHLGTAYFLSLSTSFLSVVQFWHLGFWSFSMEHFSHVPHILFWGLILLLISSTAVVEMALCTFLLKFPHPNLYAAVYFGGVTHILVALLAAYPLGAYFTNGVNNKAIRSLIRI